MTYPNGDKYEGGWLNGEKQGYGVYLYSDGSRFEGDWKNDDKNGKGTF